MSKIPLHSRVALKDGADTVYVYALAGTEGWVRGQKEDSDGFELFRIEWDKEHWRYNGQPDGWTFADHFKVIGPPDPVDQEEEDVEEDTTPDAVGMQPVARSENDLDSYMESLSEAFDAASEGEGFVVLAIRRQPNPQNPSEIAFVPTMFQHSTTKEAEMLLDIQLAELASSNYQDMIFNLMQALNPNGTDE